MPVANFCKPVESSVEHGTAAEETVFFWEGNAFRLTSSSRSYVCTFLVRIAVSDEDPR